MTNGMLRWLVLAAALTIPGGAWPVGAAAVPGKLYLVSTGPGDPAHLTLKAVDTMKAADLVLCPPDTAKKLEKYLKGKPVEDPWKELWLHQGKVWMKDLHTYKPEERAAIVAEKTRQRDEYVKKLKGLLAQGKNVALLDGGDPTVYSRGFWIVEGMAPEEVEIIPGVGAMTAAMAALKKCSTGAGARYVMLTAPYAFFGRTEPDDLARDLARHSGTLIFYMGLTELPQLVETLKKYHPEDLPVAVVYYAGFAGQEKVVQGTLKDILAKVAPEKEKWLGMIIMGRCLTGPAFVLSEGGH